MNRLIPRKKKAILFCMIPESVAGALFTPDRSEVLLIQRRDVPVWVLPGGGIEPGESPETAIVREILEETGLTVKVTRLIGAYIPINRLARFTHLYECVLVSGRLSLSAETRDISFFPLSALPALIPPPYPEWISDAWATEPPLRKTLHSVTYAALIKHSLRHPLLVVRFLLSRLGLSINS